MSAYATAMRRWLGGCLLALPTVQVIGTRRMSENNILSIEIRPDGGRRIEDKTASQPSGDRAPPAKTASPRQLMRLFSGRNVELLLLIKTRKPQSVSELARLSKRPKESLTRTLQRLAAVGIVEMRKAAGRGKAPTVACDRVRLELPLETAEKKEEPE